MNGASRTTQSILIPTPKDECLPSDISVLPLLPDDGCQTYQTLDLKMKMADPPGNARFAFLGRLDEVQEELLYYPRRWRWRRR